MPSVSMNETYWPTPGIAIGSPYLATLSHRSLNVIDRDNETRMLRRCQAPRNESLQHGHTGW
jgi:hypothetical protein